MAEKGSGPFVWLLTSDPMQQIELVGKTEPHQTKIVLECASLTGVLKQIFDVKEPKRKHKQPSLGLVVSS